MAVVQRGASWQVQVRVGKDSSGKWIRKAATCDTETEARRVERRLLAEAEAQRAAHVAPTNQTLGDYLPLWLERKRAEGCKVSTWYAYERAVRVRILPFLGKTPLHQLSPTMIQSWQDTLAPTPTTRGATQASLAYRVLRAALSDAVRLGLVPTNTAGRARPALRASRKRDGFTLAEAQFIMAAAEGDEMAPLLGFLLHTGLRIGEALGLRWSDIDMDAGRITVRHNRTRAGSLMVEGAPKREKSARTMALLSGAVAALRRQRAQQAEIQLASGKGWRDEGRVFATRGGGGMNIGTVDRAFRRIRDKANEQACKEIGKDPGVDRIIPKLPLHSLRHATASILLGAGVPVAVAAKMMGHSVAMFCETYADLLVEATHDAARQADAWLARQSASLSVTEPAGTSPQTTRPAREHRD